MNSKDLKLRTGHFLSCVCRAQEVTYLSKIGHFYFSLGTIEKDLIFQFAI